MRSIEDMRHEAPLAPDLLMRFALTLTRELVDLHAQDLVHGDLRPSRILWDGADELTLLPAEESPSEPDLPWITHWSPEQCRSERVGPRADVFAVGVLIHQMATGVHPFIDDEDEHVLDAMDSIQFTRVELPGRHRPELRLDWDAIVSICLAKDPKERYASALDLEKQLDKLSREGGRSRIRFRPHWPRIALALLVLGALLSALYLVL